jgi:hypothetical protein
LGATFRALPDLSFDGGAICAAKRAHSAAGWALRINYYVRRRRWKPLVVLLHVRCRPGGERETSVLVNNGRQCTFPMGARKFNPLRPRNRITI